jgi:predicted nucleotidyltransferase
MNAMLETLLGSKLRAKVLGWLFTHPDERYFVRQLTTLVGEDSTNVSRELARMEKIDVLVSTTEGKQKYYQANRQSPLFNELHGLIVKTTGVVDVLRSALVPLADRIKVALIYGSVARGSEKRGSDIDILVIGDVTFAEVVDELHQAQEALGRETNPTVYPVAEFRAKLAANHYFLTDVLNGPKIFLIGDDNELSRLAK